MRPFEGIKIVDCTHVLAGPFAAYQLAVLGADVIKVDDPNEPDQSRESGADHALNRAMMGTGFLTQGSNKRAIALNLKTEGGREALKRLVATWADVLVENYRPGAFTALGLGYEDLSRLNRTLIYASMTACGQHGPRGTQTAAATPSRRPPASQRRRAPRPAGRSRPGPRWSITRRERWGPLPSRPRSSSACALARASTSISPCSTSPWSFRARTSRTTSTPAITRSVPATSCASRRHPRFRRGTAWCSWPPATRGSTAASTRPSAIPKKPSGRAWRSATSAMPKSWRRWPRR